MAKPNTLMQMNCFRHVTRILVVLAAMLMLAVVATAECERRILFVHSIVYGGR